MIKSFVMYISNKGQFDLLTDEQAGKLIKALFAYADSGDVIDTDDGMVQMAFSFLSLEIERNFEKYKKTCERRAESARKRWEQRQKEDEYKKQEQKQDAKKEPEPEKKEDIHAVDIAEIISYLNQKAGTCYRTSTSSTVRHVSARLKEGYAVDDFKTVIDSKCKEWMKDEKMKKYIRPETLFGQKFESYLQSAKSRKDGDASECAGIACIDGTII